MAYEAVVVIGMFSQEIDPPRSAKYPWRRTKQLLKTSAPFVTDVILGVSLCCRLLGGCDICSSENDTSAGCGKINIFMEFIFAVFIKLSRTL